MARLRNVHAVSAACLLAVVRAGAAVDDAGAGVRAVGAPRVGQWGLVAIRREGAWERLGAILVGWVVVAWRAWVAGSRLHRGSNACAVSEDVGVAVASGGAGTVVA